MYMSESTLNVPKTLKIDDVDEAIEVDAMCNAMCNV